VFPQGFLKTLDYPGPRHDKFLHDGIGTGYGYRVSTFWCPCR